MNTSRFFWLLTFSLTSAAGHAETATAAARPSDETRAVVKAAMDACAKEAGFPARDSGNRPTRDQFALAKDCLDKKGITPDQMGHHRGPPPDGAAREEGGEEGGGPGGHHHGPPPSDNPDSES